MVVTLSAGMGEMDFTDSSQIPDSPTPMDKLKEALGSKQQFQLHYLELAELAMGTYKHIGRLRYIVNDAIKYGLAVRHLTLVFFQMR